MREGACGQTARTKDESGSALERDGIVLTVALSASCVLMTFLGPGFADCLRILFPPRKRPVQHGPT